MEKNPEAKPNYAILFNECITTITDENRPEYDNIKTNLKSDHTITIRNKKYTEEQDMKIQRTNQIFELDDISSEKQPFTDDVIDFLNHVLIKFLLLDGNSNPPKKMESNDFLKTMEFSKPVEQSMTQINAQPELRQWVPTEAELEQRKNNLRDINKKISRRNATISRSDVPVFNNIFSHWGEDPVPPGPPSSPKPPSPPPPPPSNTKPPPPSTSPPPPPPSTSPPPPPPSTSPSTTTTKTHRQPSSFNTKTDRIDETN